MILIGKIFFIFPNAIDLIIYDSFSLLDIPAFLYDNFSCGNVKRSTRTDTFISYPYAVLQSCIYTTIIKQIQLFLNAALTTKLWIFYWLFPLNWIITNALFLSCTNLLVPITTVPASPYIIMLLLIQTIVEINLDHIDRVCSRNS